MPDSMPPQRRFRLLRSLTTRIALFGGAASIGGQAVMEGVMMRSPNHWAVAIRRHNGEIVTIAREYKSFGSRHAWARLPLLRGVMGLGESLAIGYRSLSVSAHYAAEGIEAKFAEEEAREAAEKRAAAGEVEPAPVEASAPTATEEPQPHLRVVEVSVDGDADGDGVRDDEGDVDASSPEFLKTWHIVIMFAVAIGFTILLFKVLPAVLTGTILGETDQSVGFLIFEGVLKIAIFIGYLALVGLLPDMKRLFRYHSGEHKAINAWENNVPLEPELVNEQTRIHVRCGTSFLLWVMVTAIFVFAVVAQVMPDPTWWQLVVSRVLLLPVIAGISFEIIRFAGKHANNKLVRAVLAPGLWMQYITTRPCEPEHCEVAIASLTDVLKREYPDDDLAQALQHAEESRVQVI